MKEINWSEIPFGYMKTDYNVRCYYRDGAWGELEVSSSENIDIHMASTCLHYGQEAFEGLKAFMGKDGRIRVFRMDENAKRLQASSRAIMMAELPVEKFEEAVRRVVLLNKRFVPPYGSGSSVYLSPPLARGRRRPTRRSEFPAARRYSVVRGADFAAVYCAGKWGRVSCSRYG